MSNPQSFPKKSAKQSTLSGFFQPISAAGHAQQRQRIAATDAAAASAKKEARDEAAALKRGPGRPRKLPSLEVFTLMLDQIAGANGLSMSGSSYPCNVCCWELRTLLVT